MKTTLLSILLIISLSAYSQDDDTKIEVSEVDKAFNLTSTKTENGHLESLKAINLSGTFYYYYYSTTALRKFKKKIGGYYNTSGVKLSLTPAKCKLFGLQTVDSKSKVCKGEFQMKKGQGGLVDKFLVNSQTKSKLKCFDGNYAWDKSTGKCNESIACGADGGVDVNGNTITDKTKEQEKAWAIVKKLELKIKGQQYYRDGLIAPLTKAEKEDLVKRLIARVDGNKEYKWSNIRLLPNLNDKKPYEIPCDREFKILGDDKYKYGSKFYCEKEEKTSINLTPKDTRPTKVKLELKKNGLSFFADNLYDVNAGMVNTIKKFIEDNRPVGYVVSSISGNKASSSALRNTGGEYKFAGGVTNEEAKRKLEGLSKARLKALVDKIYGLYKTENASLAKSYNGQILIDGESTPYISNNNIRGYVKSSPAAQSKYLQMAANGSTSNQIKISEYYDKWQYAIVDIEFKRNESIPDIKEECVKRAIKIRIGKYTKSTGGSNSFGGNTGGRVSGDGLHGSKKDWGKTGCSFQ
jgi:hypothetical protein